MADGSSYSKILRILQRAGIAATAVQQPLTSIEDDISVVKTAIKTMQDASSEPIVVVGHSFGGVVRKFSIEILQTFSANGRGGYH